jgi:hypothetical protein
MERAVPEGYLTGLRRVLVAQCVLAEHVFDNVREGASKPRRGSVSGPLAAGLCVQIGFEFSKAERVSEGSQGIIRTLTVTTTSIVDTQKKYLQSQQFVHPDLAAGASGAAEPIETTIRGSSLKTTTTVKCSEHSPRGSAREGNSRNKISWTLCESILRAGVLCGGSRYTLEVARNQTQLPGFEPILDREQDLLSASSSGRSRVQPWRSGGAPSGR